MLKFSQTHFYLFSHSTEIAKIVFKMKFGFLLTLLQVKNAQKISEKPDLVAILPEQHEGETEDGEIAQGAPKWRAAEGKAL